MSSRNALGNPPVKDGIEEAIRKAEECKTYGKEVGYKHARTFEGPVKHKGPEWRYGSANDINHFQCGSCGGTYQRRWTEEERKEFRMVTEEIVFSAAATA